MDRFDRGLNKSRQQKTLLASSAFPGSCRAACLLIPVPRDDYSSACLKTPDRREDKCPSARAGKRPRAGGAERGRAYAPPLSLRGCSAVCFCLFMPVICLLLMMLLFLLLFFFFLLL
ncbi:hypothetical protein ED265_18725 [Salmonella enterica]|nr:hypothetical protein [Salmonella enterica subsp. enterica serovar Heidelberg]EFE7580115.1 hypothetical protein [Escherichia coli]MEY68579.1 hypothetical protein [Salmonella enterica]